MHRRILGCPPEQNIAHVGAGLGHSISRFAAVNDASKELMRFEEDTISSAWTKRKRHLYDLIVFNLEYRIVIGETIGDD